MRNKTMDKVILKTLITNNLDRARTARYIGKGGVYLPSKGTVLVDGIYPDLCDTKAQAKAMEFEIINNQISVAVVTNLNTITPEEADERVSVAPKKTVAPEKAAAPVMPNVIKGDKKDSVLGGEAKSQDEIQAEHMKSATRDNAFAAGSIEDNSPAAKPITSEHVPADVKESDSKFSKASASTEVSADEKVKIGKPEKADLNVGKPVGEAPKEEAPKEEAPKEETPKLRRQPAGKSKAPRSRSSKK
jgi:hypothetical protein